MDPLTPALVKIIAIALFTAIMCLFGAQCDEWIESAKETTHDQRSSS